MRYKLLQQLDQLATQLQEPERNPYFCIASKYSLLERYTFCIFNLLIYSSSFASQQKMAAQRPPYIIHLLGIPMLSVNRTPMCARRSSIAKDFLNKATKLAKA